MGKINALRDDHHSSYLVITSPGYWASRHRPVPCRPVPCGTSDARISNVHYYITHSAFAEKSGRGCLSALSTPSTEQRWLAKCYVRSSVTIICLLNSPEPEVVRWSRVGSANLVPGVYVYSTRYCPVPRPHAIRASC